MRGRKKDLVIKQKRKYITIVGKLPLQKEKKKKHTHRKLQKKILYLGLGLWRALLGINSLRVDITSFRLNHLIFGLRDHVLNCEIIFGLIGLDYWLDLLTLPSHY